MKTHMASKKTLEQERKWYIVDLQGKVLGRQATRIANVLRGKHKPEYTPFLDCGDFVIVINADKVRLTGSKPQKKIYYRHSNYPGGLYERTAEQLLSSHPERLIREAVRGMLPKGSLAHHVLQKLKVYSGGEHPHQAQMPQPLE